MILIIDDDAKFATAFQEFLRIAALDAFSVTSSEKALALLDAKAPRLIILDPHLPESDGLALLRTIRADPAFKSVPILILTREMSRECEAKFFDAGAQDILIKGTRDWPSLLHRITELLGIAPPPALETGA